MARAALADIERLEDKIDKTVAGGVEIDLALGGVQFRSMIELMEFSKLMAVSDLAVPPHLRGNPGACLAICTKALRNGFDPFSLAEHSYAMKKDTEITKVNQNGGRVTEKVPVETIAYDSAVIRAIINAHAPVVDGLAYTYAGEGDEMTCTVSGKTRAGEVKTLTSPTLGQRKKDIGFSERGNLKGSPLWISKPKQQLGYDTGRDWCRLYHPEILLGWYDKDEFAENTKPAPVEKETPQIGSRLGGKSGGRGFSAEGVNKALEHKPGAVLATTAKAQPEPLTVDAVAQVADAEPAKAQELDLGDSAESEVAAKKKIVAGCNDLADLKEIASGVTDYLKDAKRTDLLSDFLSVVAAREDKLKEF